MVKLYKVASDGSTEELHQVVCKNEDKELQRLLERNPNLLPGDQISPDDPRRWLIIEREMPVPDPSTGENRWNIDFLMADQDAVPTFVEVKRFGTHGPAAKSSGKCSSTRPTDITTGPRIK